MKFNRKLTSSALFFFEVFAISDVAMAQAPPSPAVTGPVFHIRAVGNLECARDESNIRSFIEEACNAKSPLVVLDLSGNGSRLDLVWKLGKAIRTSTVPVVVYLADPDDKVVGPGQFCLGLLAGSCALGPGTSIRGLTNTPGLTSLAPERTEWSALGSELYEWLQKRHPTPPVPDGLLAAVVSPTRPLWIDLSGTDPRVTPERPGKDQSLAPLVVDVRGTPQVALDAAAAVKLGLCELEPQWTALITRAGVQTTARTDRSLSLGLAEPARRFAELSAQVDAADETLKAALKLPWPAAKSVASETYHGAAAKARGTLEDANAAMTQLEQLLTDYPELMRRPAPDQTEVGAKPSAYAARWRSLIQTRKDHLARHAATAEKFAQVKD
jgi:hypothetical protein